LNLETPFPLFQPNHSAPTPPPLLATLVWETLKAQQFTNQRSTIGSLVSPMTIIGKAITVNGTIEAEEPLSIAGTVLGNVRVANHEVVLEPDARVEGAVTGRTIIVRGRSSGRLIARELVRVQRSATVQADIAAPKLALEEGALFNGAVEPAVKANAVLLVAAYRKKTQRIADC
jgi:cytoskeletal protein CcmA (bactofilin family)